MAILQTEIRGELTAAMKAKAEPKLTVLRGLLTAFTNELVSLRRGPQGELSDDEVLAIIRRAVKQRKDSIEQYTRGNRPELVAAERAELDLLEKYLPQMMGKEEIMQYAMQKKVELNLTEKAQSGLFMATLMKDLRGKAEGADVKEVVGMLLG
jgi:uncharacterized protein YqeY